MVEHRRLPLDGASWWPGHRLGAITLTWFERPSAEDHRISSVADGVSISDPTPMGAFQYVRPMDIDPLSGRIQPSNEAYGSYGACLGNGLRLGDVLLPRSGHAPAILVSEHLERLLFSPSFVALRPRDVEPVFLWALLSCRSGLAARDTWFSSPNAAGGPTVRALAMPLPRIPAASNTALLEQLRSTVPAQVDAMHLLSEWHEEDLGAASTWMRSTSASHHVKLAEHFTLASGRVDRKSFFGFAGENRLPVVDIDYVRGKSSSLRYWARSATSVPTRDAVLLITRNEPFRVRMAPPGCLVARDLVRVEARSGRPQQANALARYFASQDGLGSLRASSAGVTIRHIAIKALRELEVPAGYEELYSSTDQPDLPSRLEALLGREFA